jgi:hypothetical protein
MEYSWTVPTLATGFLAGKLATIQGVENPYIYRTLQIGCYGLIGLSGINMMLNPKNDIVEATHEGITQPNLQEKSK